MSETEVQTEITKVIFSYKEAAAMLGISVSQLQKIKESVSRIEIGRSVGFAMEDIHAIKDQFRVMPAPASIEVPHALLELKPRRSRIS